MSSIASVPRPVLTDLIPRPKSRVRALGIDGGLVLTGAALVAALAQITIPMWPVPITGQTLGVIIVGTALGAWRGAAALTAYMIAGLAGLPVFAGLTGSIATIVTPSFGYIIGFIPAAYAAGWFAQRAWDRTPWIALIGFTVASVIPFLTGVPYMAMIVNAVLGAGYGFGQIIASGFTVFIVGGLVKAVIAALVVPLAWAAVRRIDTRKQPR